MTPLEKLRGKTDLKIEDVRKALQVNRVHYWRIEKGRARPSYELATKIVEFWRLRGLSVSTDEIFYPRKRKAKTAGKLAA